MNFLRVTKGNFNFPSHGLAGVVKNKFQPREAEPRVVGILFLYYVHCIIESENLVYGTTNRNFLIIWRNLQIPKKVGSSRSTGCSNSICAKVNTYQAIKNALLSYKNRICTFIRCGHLTYDLWIWLKVPSMASTASDSKSGKKSIKQWIFDDSFHNERLRQVILLPS